MKGNVLLFIVAVAMVPLTGFAGGHAGDRDEGPSVREDIDFVLHLMARGDLDEGLFVLEGMHPADAHWSDSLSYLTGWILYRQQRLEASARHLLQVNRDSPLFQKSHFFAAYNLAHSGNQSAARSVLNGIGPEGGSMPAALQQLQLGGLALLERDFDSYQRKAVVYSGQYHVMAREEQMMAAHYDRLRGRPDRHPWAGGVLSAVVPGLGKVYAGKTAEGIAGFLYVASMGLTSYDFYRSGGSGSVLFIVSASITGIFYAGNILGSISAVRRSNNEFNHEMDQRILFDMHIPLRNAFN